MRLSLLPTAIAGAVTELKPEALARRGVRLLMLDFDNTVVPYTTDMPTPAVSAWLESFRDSPVKLCVVSNSKKPRVVRFCQARGIDCVTHAKKPFPRGIRVCLHRYGFAPSQCALVGDQIFTDTLGANCAGVRSILVKAIHNHNFWLKARHAAELPFIFLARKRRITQ